MSKFTIENLIIEKSDKDIKTNIKYEFLDGLNLICGNNEAGKSSLMQFIKTAFFQTKGIDTGKIFFKIINENNLTCYRADIKNAVKKTDRCKLYDTNNNICAYSLIEKNINQKYFEQGFNITLDDLMNLQYDNNLSLVNVIKDPSGDKLNIYLDKLKIKTRNIMGDSGRLTKETNLILEKITALNSQINELSNKETQYNNSITAINTLTEEIENIIKNEEFYNILLNLNKAKEQSNSLEENYRLLIIDFNEKFYNNKENYLEVLHNSGKYESNITILNKHKQKFEALKNKICQNIKQFNNEYAININENDITDFIIDNEKINKIKGYITQVNNLINDSVKSQASIDTIEENLLKLKHDLLQLKAKNITQEKYQDLEEIYKFTENGLKQYNYLLNRINEIEKSEKKSKQEITLDKKIIILFILLFVMTILSAIICFYQEVNTAGIFSILMTILLIFASFIIKNGRKQNTVQLEQNRLEDIKNNLLNELKNKIRKYYPEIDNIETSYMPFKIENINQEICNKIQSYNQLNEQITKNITETNYNQEKSDKLTNKLADIKQKIISLQEETIILIKSDNQNFEYNPLIQSMTGFLSEFEYSNIFDNKYLNAIEIIKSIKEDIYEKNTIEKEIIEITNNNEEIIKTLNKFLIDNDINITPINNFEENMLKLKNYNEKNTEIKNKINILNVETESLKNKINKLEQEKSQYIEFKDISASAEYIQEKIQELKKNKLEKQNLKQEAEFKKRELEKFEGLNNIKLEKNILLDEYRKKVEELFENKMILALTNTAKANFDKTLPDLINAQRYLSILTDGKYTKINLDLEEIENNEKTKIKKWQELSRGTKEQLYLALRLGYASNYSKDKTTGEYKGKPDLPLIIDDAFVNFDSIRTKNALKCLIEFSKTNQVLFFTCHSEIILKHFESLGLNKNKNFNVINM